MIARIVTLVFSVAALGFYALMAIVFGILISSYGRTPSPSLAATTSKIVSYAFLSGGLAAWLRPFTDSRIPFQFGRLEPSVSPRVSIVMHWIAGAIFVFYGLRLASLSAL